MSALDNDGSLSLETVLERLLDAREEEIHTALPGRIESYDAATQTADITPLIRRRIPRTDGTDLSEMIPTIRSVPVLWPRAGSWFLHMPLDVGDTVLLVICERDPTGWRVTGEASDPIDVRVHHPAHAVAIPGLFPKTQPITDAESNEAVLGAMVPQGAPDPIFPPLTVRVGRQHIRLGDASAEDFVALASKVRAELDALWNALNTHTHPTPSGASSAPTGAPLGSAGDVASHKVKSL